jgi:hypothetical protein
MRAAMVGGLASVVAVGVQYFVGIPVGNQPDWLATLTLVTAVPSAYVTFPLKAPFERLLDFQVGSGRIFEVETPFGPAFRVGGADLAMVALGTLLMVGLAAYLAAGISEMYDEAHI